MTRKEPKASDGEKEFHLWAFVSFIKFMASDQEAIRTFEAETGTRIQTGLSPLERMIDKASGYDRQLFETFAKWCAGVYGEEFLPQDYLDRLMKPATT